jgi:oligoendopeptidase F
MNIDFVLFHLTNAHEALSELITDMKSDPDYDYGEYVVDMTHVYVRRLYWILFALAVACCSCLYLRVLTLDFRVSDWQADTMDQSRRQFLKAGAVATAGLMTAPLATAKPKTLKHGWSLARSFPCSIRYRVTRR